MDSDINIQFSEKDKILNDFVIFLKSVAKQFCRDTFFKLLYNYDEKKYLVQKHEEKYKVFFIVIFHLYYINFYYLQSLQNIVANYQVV